MRKSKAKQITTKGSKSSYAILVAISPWYALILGIYGLLIGLTTVNLSPFATSGGLQMSPTVIVSGFLLIIANLFLIMSFSRQLRREKKGWKLFVIGQSINLFSALILFDLFRAVWDILIIYLLFRIAKFYK